MGRASKRDGQMGEAADAYPDATRARAAENLSNGSLRTPRLLAVGRFRTIVSHLNLPDMHFR